MNIKTAVFRINRREAAKPNLPHYRFGFILLLAGLLASCSSPEEQSLTAPSPSGQSGPVDVDGVRFGVIVYENPQRTKAHVGIDLRTAGLLPLSIAIDNRGDGPVKIIPRQTFLIDQDNQAWPLLTADQAFNRLKLGEPHGQKAVRVPPPNELDSLTGFAIEVASASGFPRDADAYSRLAKRFIQNLSVKTLHNPHIPPKEGASGLLFFPGKEEANGARGLRLCYEQNGRLKFLTLPLKASAPLESAP